MIGSIRNRPDYRTLRPDFGAVKLIPRILKLMSERDGGLLAGVAAIIEENGISVVSPLVDRSRPSAQRGDVDGGSKRAVDLRTSIRRAKAALEVGGRDIAQARGRGGWQRGRRRRRRRAPTRCSSAWRSFAAKGPFERLAACW